MTRRMFRLAVLVSLSSFLTAAAMAQTDTRLGTIVVTDPREQSFGLAEDMQIMGQILDDALEALYPPHEQVFSIAFDSGVVQTPRSPGKIRAPHGVYLDRYGVVYQLEAPPLYEVPEIKMPKAVRRVPRKPLTVWEKTRRRLRGEKVQAPKRTSQFVPMLGVVVLEENAFTYVAAAPTEEQMVRKLLDVLAKNGHNFRHLGPEERLTVAITFRKKTSKSQPKKKRGPQDSAAGGTRSGSGATSNAFGIGRMAASASSGIRRLKSNDETTGDLHRRQGDDKKAIEAYEKALRQSFLLAGDNLYPHYSPIMFPSGDLSPKNRRLMQKLSQAQIGAGNFDKARQVLENLSRAEAAAKDASKSKSKAHKKGSLPFSAQLVVSVKKADLDAVAAGKIKGDEFKKRATLRYIDPGTFKQKESKSGQENGKAKKTTKLNGVIRRVDTTNGLVWINLGALDSLSKRALFDVYSKVQATTKSQPTDVKGRIEVTRILGPHLAEARILDHKLRSPIAPGNAIVARTRSSAAKPDEQRP